MLACELRLGGAHPVVLERLPVRSDAARANGLVGQVVQFLDHRGLYQRIAGDSAKPTPTPFFMFGGLPLDLRALPDNPLYTLPVPQRRLERILEERANELGAEIRRGHDVIAFSADEERVTVDVDGPDGRYELRTRYLVGCDGAHSVVRRLAGIDFPGVTAQDLISRSAHVVLPAAMLVPGTGELELPRSGRLRPFMYHRTGDGVFVFASFEPGVHLVNSLEWDRRTIDEQAPMSLVELRDSVGRVLGEDLPMSLPPAGGNYVLRRLASGNTRLAERYRTGRVLLAGDAAHVHSGIGGPGLNLGLQDVVNLGWKLAAEIGGWAPPGLLDTYQTERYPLGERVNLQTQAQAALLAPGSAVTALRTLFGELLHQERNVRHIAETMAGTDIRYDMGSHASPHPLLGRWMPDIALVTPDGPTRVAELMRAARPVLLNLAGSTVDAAPLLAQGWRGRVDIVIARCAAGPAPAAAILLRPDGYVAWVGTMDDPEHGLRDALSAWFGAPADLVRV
jgi:2-polyprenyl-6-methoxyphenol hydroxylase-like FAD-dependent oxidoreductase